MTSPSPPDPIPATELVDRGRAIRVHTREADDLCDLLNLLGVRCGRPRLPVASEEGSITPATPTGVKLNLPRLLAFDHDAANSAPEPTPEVAPADPSESSSLTESSTPWREIPLEPAPPEELRRITELVAEFNRQRGSRAAFDES